MSITKDDAIRAALMVFEASTREEARAESLEQIKYWQAQDAEHLRDLKGAQGEIKGLQEMLDNISAAAGVPTFPRGDAHTVAVRKLKSYVSLVEQQAERDAELRNEIDELKRALRNAQDHATQIQTDYSNYQECHDRFFREHLDLQKEREGLKGEVQRLKIECTDHEFEITKMGGKITRLENELKGLPALEAECAKAKAELAELKHHLNKLVEGAKT